jgi:hypothetical protein
MEAQMRTVITCCCISGALFLHIDSARLVQAEQLAATWHVDDDAPNDPGPGNLAISDPLEDGSSAHPFDSIQEAIDVASNGDSISVLAGTYYERINYGGKALGVVGAGSATTIIDGEGIGTVVRCVSGEGLGTVLQGVTITGGNAFEGGGMFNIDSIPQIIDCTFTGNYACYGGAIYNRNSDAVITDCVFTTNSGCHGAGIWNDGNSQTVVAECKFKENTASVWGGGIVSAGKPTNMTLQASMLCANVPDQIYEGNYTDDGGNSLSNDCCPADLDDSGDVAVDDLLVVIAFWGNPGAFEGIADINDDLLVNVDDLLLIINSWGQCP